MISPLAMLLWTVAACLSQVHGWMTTTTTTEKTVFSSSSSSFGLTLAHSWSCHPSRQSSSSSTRSSWLSPSTTRLASTRSDDNTNNNSHDDFPEDDCQDEEECEIDWDKMMFPMDQEQPQQEGDSENNHNDNTSESTPASSESESTSSSSSSTPPPAQPTNSHSSRSNVDTETARLRLEMLWGVTEAAEECEVERPETCGSQPCPDCRGRGQCKCRFCHGTALLGFEVQRDQMDTGRPSTSASSFSTCPICKDGMEVCGSCKGTGWVADWTRTPAQEPYSGP